MLGAQECQALLVSWGAAFRGWWQSSGPEPFLLARVVWVWLEKAWNEFLKPHENCWG